ncbi:MAG: phosphoenolpyruvate--protein phosphotransferase [Kiritimatiellia bacterium]
MATGNKTAEKRVQGLSLSKGVALGRVCLFDDHRHQEVPDYAIEPAQLNDEVKRMEDAVEATAQQLENIRAHVENRMGQAEAGIFVAQKMIVEDPMILKQLREHIRSALRNAENAIHTVLDAYETKLGALDNEYIRERASDIGEIRRRLLDNLSNTAPGFSCAGRCRRGKNRIVIAEELTPSLTVSLNTGEVLAFVTEHGGVNSHAAILARALGIPAVSGIKNIHSTVACGTELIVNGDTGEVIISPDERTIAACSCEAGRARRDGAVDTVPQLQVMANITLGREVSEAREMKAEGIGLYRTEFEFISAGELLSEEAQYTRYAPVVEAMEGRVTTFRMLDAGGDKPLPAMRIPKEENPALGLRGSRLLIRHPNLFRDQARAIARASLKGPVRVMFPMIVDVAQFRRLRDMFKEMVEDIKTGSIEFGVMFEVPSAALQADAILAEAQFASIGTNDLTQYLFAVDRGNELVTDEYTSDHPVFWQVLRGIAAAAEKHRRSLSVCGELASDPVMVRKLMECGIKSVSCSPRAIPAVRKAAVS